MIERITWVDSYGCGPSWRTLDELPDACICNSVGWVIRENEEVLVIAPHYSEPSDGDTVYCGEMVIPIACIRERVQLQSRETP